MVADWDEVACRWGTDRGSWHHDYMPLYQQLLEGREVKRLLEIGVAGGRGLFTWAELLPDTQIVGVDVIPECRLHQRERIDVVIADGSDGPVMWALSVLYGPFDFVIDDSVHELRHVAATFEAAYPRMEEGGIYVIEDLDHTDPAVIEFVERRGGRFMVPRAISPAAPDVPSSLIVIQR